MKEFYLNTLRDTLTGHVYQDRKVACYRFNKLLRLFGWQISRETSDHERHNGKIWPQTALTMAGTKRLDNIRDLINLCDAEKINGDFVECGVWRGGASIFAAGVCKMNQNGRLIFACDSFEGLPKPKDTLDKIDPLHLFKFKDVLAVSQEQVWQNFSRFGLEQNVQLFKGWFSDTLKKLPTKSIAILRADGDMFESTMDILGLYDRVTPGGFVIIDDYNAISACKQAVDGFISGKGIQLMPIDEDAVYWKKK
jgi:hypothetical protein